tara:strand:- start:785 stop:970 length:186 start_codon:yes stop_codon:yes gene_type:complete
MTRRDIPPKHFRFWGDVFKEKRIHDEYGKELSELFYLLADNAEFHEALEQNWGDWYSEKLH